MTIGYKQKFDDGKPTHFREKILKYYEDDFARTQFKLTPDQLIEYLPIIDTIKPKIHTIRPDVPGRWREGIKIHHCYNNRTKDRQCFFENVCTRVQPIQIIWSKEIGTDENGTQEVVGFTQTVIVGGIVLPEAKILDLAINDGFDSIEHFFSWFKQDFSGRIIHWTDHKY